MPFDEGLDSGPLGQLGIAGARLSSELMRLMELEAIAPGSDIGYEACKTIYTNHPLGSRMVDLPLQMAMSQQREIHVGAPGEESLKDAYLREWKRIGAIGADNIIYRATQISYIYGISTLGANIVGANPADSLPVEDLYKHDMYFNIFDPLNTAGSLVLNQDPTAVDFLHPKQVSVGSQIWNNSKTMVLMHEQPIWIKWTDSAFGFVGRSVYQRAFYPLKSFLVSMLADQFAQEKIGLLVWKAASPGAVLDMAARVFKGMQRQSIKGAKTFNVVSIGENESLESLNLEHLEGAGRYSRENILKNIATGAGMPAALLNQETLTSGFGEGTEDAKQIARYIDRVRIEMDTAYQFMDRIVQRRAWNPIFYEEIKRSFPETYGDLEYEAAFRMWSDAFDAQWPNLLSEPESEKQKGVQARLQAATDLFKTIAPSLDPENKARAIMWLVDVANAEEETFSNPLVLDEDAIAQYEPPILQGTEPNDTGLAEANQATYEQP
jgi:hypothetical protein